jgi:hypothetical protein
MLPSSRAVASGAKRGPGTSLHDLSAANDADCVHHGGPSRIAAANGVQFVEAGSRICALFERFVRDDG